MTSNRTDRSRALLCGAALALLTGAAAFYVFPLKLAFGSEASWYVFGYAGDEYLYAQRIQPLPPGVSAANSVNAVVDPGVISPYFLEDLCRLFLRATGMHTITFFWIWRFVFPVVMILTLGGMLFVAMPPRQRRWSWSLSLSAAAASFPLLLAAYDVLTRFPPLQGWLVRIPTNIEYPLSIAVAAAAVHFVRKPKGSSAILLALALAALVYLRVYTAIPWALALIIVPARMLLSPTDRSNALVFGAAFAALTAPWLAINLWNGSLDTFRELVARYFMPSDWQRSPFTVGYLCCGAVLSGLSMLLRSGERLLVAACGASIALMSFVSGLLPFARELFMFDRMGSFYLIALLMALGMLLSAQTRLWRGSRGARSATNVSLAVLACGFFCGAATCARNLGIDFNTYPASPYPSVRADLPCVKGYEWVHANTRPDALFIVADAVDWSAFKTDEERTAAWKQFTLADDLFSVVAQRPRAHHIRMYINAISDEQYRLLKALHYGTVGMPDGMEIDFRDYVAAFEKFKPAYIFWKKRSPYPRAMGLRLKDHCKVVYQDDACEIWEIGPDTLQHALHR